MPKSKLSKDESEKILERIRERELREWTESSIDEKDANRNSIRNVRALSENAKNVTFSFSVSQWQSKIRAILKPSWGCTLPTG